MKTIIKVKASSAIFLILTISVIIFILVGVWKIWMAASTSVAVKSFPVNVGVIRATAGDPLLVDKIKTLINEQPNVDLIVTPEYSLYPGGYGFKTDIPRIKIDCPVGGGSCTLVNVSNGQSLISKVQKIQQIAKNSKVNILLGTMPLEYTLTRQNYNSFLQKPLFNSLLKITKDGTLIAPRSKVSGSDWCVPATQGHSKSCEGYQEMYPQFYPYYYNENVSISLKGAIPLVLTNRQGMSFSIFITICADINDNQVILKSGNTPRDILVWSTVNGPDARAYETTLNIQSKKTFAWPSLISNVIKKYIEEKKSISTNGYFVSADPNKNGLGIFSFSKKPLNNFVDKPDYLYGQIFIYR